MVIISADIYRRRVVELDEDFPVERDETAEIFSEIAFLLAACVGILARNCNYLEQ